MKVLVSPTDSELASEIGDDAILSSLPETKGADVLIYTPLGLYGLQRKRVPEDFVASVNDGRMSRETSLLRDNCDFKRLICEGSFRYRSDGTLIVGRKFPGVYTRERIRGMLFDIWHVKGIPYDYTEDMKDTVRYIRYIIKYFSAQHHDSLFVRPSTKSKWVTPTSSEKDLWLLQGFDGIGPGLADAIIKQFNGRVPLQWTCTLEELKRIPRLGKMADEIYYRLQPPKKETLLDKINKLKR